jgi:hypothetical protein
LRLLLLQRLLLLLQLLPLLAMLPVVLRLNLAQQNQENESLVAKLMCDRLMDLTN